MDCTSNWDHNTLINELTQGMEQAGQLKLQLGSASFQVQDLLLQGVLSSFQKALLILHWNGSVAQPLSTLESSVPMDGSPLSQALNPNFKDHQSLNSNASKKRKAFPTWTEQVKVSIKHGLEGPSDDGYSWRKYGQKDILGAKYPRSYYRCPHRYLKNCWATKQVQRSDDHPTVFDIKYRGHHTCNQVSNNSVALLGSPEEKGLKQSNMHINNQTQTPSQMLVNFQTTLGEKTGESRGNATGYPLAFTSAWTCVDGENQFDLTSTAADESLLGTRTTSLLSSNMHDSSNFSASSCTTNINLGATHLQHYESDLIETMTAYASATNTTNAGFKNWIDTVDLDPSFLYDMSGLL